MHTVTLQTRMNVETVFMRSVHVGQTGLETLNISKSPSLYINIYILILNLTQGSQH